MSDFYGEFDPDWHYIPGIDSPKAHVVMTLAEREQGGISPPLPPIDGVVNGSPRGNRSEH